VIVPTDRKKIETHPVPPPIPLTLRRPAPRVKRKTSGTATACIELDMARADEQGTETKESFPKLETSRSNLRKVSKDTCNPGQAGKGEKIPRKGPRTYFSSS